MGGVEIVVMVVLLGICVVLPSVVLVLSHLRKMGELRQGQKGVGQDMLVQRLDAIQHELYELRNRQNELILQKHDQTSPPPVPKIAERIQE